MKSIMMRKFLLVAFIALLINSTGTVADDFADFAQGKFLIHYLFVFRRLLSDIE